MNAVTHLVICAAIVDSAHACRTRLPAEQDIVQRIAGADIIFRGVYIQRALSGGRIEMIFQVTTAALGPSRGETVKVVTGDPCAAWHIPPNGRSSEMHTVIAKKMDDGQILEIWGAREKHLSDADLAKLYPRVARPQ